MLRQTIWKVKKRKLRRPIRKGRKGKYRSKKSELEKKSCP